LGVAVLGANDAIVSTASLVVGVAAVEATRHDVLVAGVAGLIVGVKPSHPFGAYPFGIDDRCREWTASAALTIG
jgi:hypothetical protein